MLSDTHVIKLRRLSPFVRPTVVSYIYFAVILMLIVVANTLFSNKLSLQDGPVAVVSRKLALLSVTENDHIGFKELSVTSLRFDSSMNMSSSEERIAWFKNKLSYLDILKSTEKSSHFDSKVKFFFNHGGCCKIQVFMTWISPVESFGVREFFALESLFKSNPKACLVIVSKTMDSVQGYKILKPLIDLGYKVSALSPDLNFLIRETPGEIWFDEIKKGVKDPGEIPLPQNLSNLIRLTLLYKYGGIYLDTDFIILKDLSTLHNSIGAQSIDMYGNWTRLNNAVLIFDKGHRLLHKFIDEFAKNFDGNKWGYNGPYLVSRVVKNLTNVKEYDVTILTPMAFYPADWTRIKGYFDRPKDRMEARWVEAKVRQLREFTFGIHLWNKQSKMMLIEKGGVMERLISEHCIICKGIYDPVRSTATVTSSTAKSGS